MSDVNQLRHDENADERFDVLAARYLADDLDGADAEEFRVMLAADPERCGQLSVMALYSHWISAQLAPELQVHSEPSLSQQLAGAAGPQLSLRLGFLRAAYHRSSRGAFLVGALTLLVVAAAFVGLYLAMSRPGHDDQMIAQPSQADRDDSRGTQVAIVRRVNATRWSASTTPKGPDATVSPGEVLAIEAGLVELQLRQGATLVVEGPAEWTIDGENNARLKQGKLVAVVPQRAVGFTLETPAATIVDLGTEFGVEVNESGQADVIVSRGRVSVQAASGAALPQSAAFELRAGESRRVQLDGTVEVAENTAPGLLNLLANSPAAEQTERKVFPVGLVAYWAFDEDGESIRDGHGLNHGQTSVENRTNGLIGRAALRSAGRSGKLAEIYSCEPAETFSDAISIEALLVTSWSGKPDDTDYICRKVQGSSVLASLAFRNDDRNSVAGPVLAWDIATERGLQSLQLPLDARTGGNLLKLLKDGKPHHVVATFDGASGEMAIYIDGTEKIRQAGVPARLSQIDEQLDSPSPNPTGLSDDSFTGVLDEIAVYCVALSPAVVAGHWRNVSHGHGYFYSP